MINLSQRGKAAAECGRKMKKKKSNLTKEIWGKGGKENAKAIGDEREEL